MAVARTDGKGQTSYFEYDEVGRQVTARYAGVEPVYFEYDLAGNRTVMQDEWGASYWSYDALGRPVSRQDPRGTVVYYAYGEAGQRTELTVLGQGTVYYGYDAVGRMEYVLDGKTDKATYYDYDAAGRVSMSGSPLTSGHNGRGPVTRIAIVVPVLLGLLLTACKRGEESMSKPEATDPLAGSLLLEALLADQRGHIHIAAQYLSSSGGPELPVPLLQSLEDWKEIGRDRLEWLRAQSEKDQERFVTGFLKFTQIAAPYFGPDPDP